MMTDAEETPRRQYPKRGPISIASIAFTIVGAIFSIIKVTYAFEAYRLYLFQGTGQKISLFETMAQFVNPLWDFAMFCAIALVIQLLSDIRWHLAKNNSFKLGL